MKTADVPPISSVENDRLAKVMLLVSQSRVCDFNARVGSTRL